jgi:hypothetical protein
MTKKNKLIHMAYTLYYTDVPRLINVFVTFKGSLTSRSCFIKDAAVSPNGTLNPNAAVFNHLR